MYRRLFFEEAVKVGRLLSREVVILYNPSRQEMRHILDALTPGS